MKTPLTLALHPIQDIPTGGLRVVLKKDKKKKKSTQSAELQRASARALAYSNTIRWTDQERARMAFTDATTEVWCAARVEGVMSRLVRCKKPVLVDTSIPGGRQRWALTPLGRDFVEILGPAGGLGTVREEFSQHGFNPLIDLFWKHAAKLPSAGQFMLPYDVTALSTCVDAIRKEARSKKFIRRRNLHLKHVRQNTKSLLTYIDELFDHRGRHLVIRLDTSYVRALCGGTAEDAIDYPRVRRDREEFLAYLQSDACPALLRGHAWSLEMGRCAGYHYHWLLFFDGNDSRQDVVLGRVLGEYWQNVVTEKQGRYYNCNADDHHRRGVGMIDHWNTEKMTNLKEFVAPYLTKADYLIRTLVEDGKTFSHGRVPPRKPQTGRPRTRIPLDSVGQ